MCTSTSHKISPRSKANRFSAHLSYFKLQGCPQLQSKYCYKDKRKIHLPKRLEYSSKLGCVEWTMASFLHFKRPHRETIENATGWNARNANIGQNANKRDNWAADGHELQTHAQTLETYIFRGHPLSIFISPLPLPPLPLHVPRLAFGRPRRSHAYWQPLFLLVLPVSLAASRWPRPRWSPGPAAGRADLIVRGRARCPFGQRRQPAGSCSYHRTDRPDPPRPRLLVHPPPTPGRPLSSRRQPGLLGATTRVRTTHISLPLPPPPTLLPRRHPFRDSRRRRDGPQPSHRTDSSP
ncbi:hypothetical protein B0H11DRAFT_2060374 [Mycena galericulata]|nr:hypothetical protein B0H11DRAFT_2060374 [Mycena galericulata]